MQRIWKKIKALPKRKQILLALFSGLAIIGITIFIWAAITGKIKPFAAGGTEIINTATVTYTDQNNIQHTINSNQVVTQILPSTNEIDRTTCGAVTARGENTGAGEVKENAFDDNINTKWLDFASTTWIQYQFCNNNAYKITKYTIASANDSPDRDPKTWTLKGSNDGTNWTNLDTQTNQSFAARFQKNTYSFINTTAYKNYRLEIQNNGSISYTQLAEIELIEITGASDTQAPSTPANLTAAATSSSQINLSWGASTDNVGVTGYNIYRNGTKLASPPITGTTFSDTGLTAGATYNYQVTAYDAAGNESGKSNQIAATTPTQTSTINLQISLQGRTNQATTGTTLTVYQAGTVTNPVLTKTDIATDSTGKSSFTITPLANGNYDFKVKPKYFLTKTITNQPFADPLNLSYSDFRGGDLNNDDIVNTLDFAQLNSKWGLTDPIADINKDGIVNSIDFAILNSNWFLQGQ